jgi:hypothetical protein
MVGRLTTSSCSSSSTSLLSVSMFEVWTGLYFLLIYRWPTVTHNNACTIAPPLLCAWYLGNAN